MTNRLPGEEVFIFDEGVTDRPASIEGKARIMVASDRPGWAWVKFSPTGDTVERYIHEDGQEDPGSFVRGLVDQWSEKYKAH